MWNHRLLLGFFFLLLQGCQGWSPNQPKPPPSTILSRFSQTVLTPAVLAATLFLHPAVASDETLLQDLSKEDGIRIERRAPPPIQSTSSPKALALADQLTSVHARMYGAYW
jgi:hypothetical protein